jgi:hypothetical protein
MYNIVYYCVQNIIYENLLFHNLYSSWDSGGINHFRAAISKNYRFKFWIRSEKWGSEYVSNCWTGVTLCTLHSHTVFVTKEVEKSNLYKDLEGVMDWAESDKKPLMKRENQKENEEKQKRE